MLKKLLTVGALATALIGGIGTASAEFSGYTYCIDGLQGYDGGKNVLSIVHSYNNFSNVLYRDGFKWYFKASKSCGDGLQYVALYER
ncbi:hypothetical protein EAE91_08080 [Photorhabdus noenieputensis]|uniref:LCI fold-containing protein n=1 Tax=Photorhabdus noenieputensis TaxID=1208607 RepID=UPI001BD6D49D|nr:LCI fold-containing protein [Photorhabdus noenieputensis]MBS9437133.1 hypothetical protein [Photorhabdus noenieputensis]MCK3670458.1 hypothetical protein [Photorhabdus noenieputensis]